MASLSSLLQSVLSLLSSRLQQRPASSLPQTAYSQPRQQALPFDLNGFLAHVDRIIARVSPYTTLGWPSGMGGSSSASANASAYGGGYPSLSSANASAYAGTYPSTSSAKSSAYASGTSSATSQAKASTSQYQPSAPASYSWPSASSVSQPTYSGSSSLGSLSMMPRINFNPSLNQNQYSYLPLGAQGSLNSVMNASLSLNPVRYY